MGLATPTPPVRDDCDERGLRPFFLTEAGPRTWEGKAGYTGCAGYPHMTHLPMWAGMQEYVGSRRCPTQRVSQVAHAVCILNHG